MSGKVSKSVRDWDPKELLDRRRISGHQRVQILLVAAVAAAAVSVELVEVKTESPSVGGLNGSDHFVKTFCLRCSVFAK